MKEAEKTATEALTQGSRGILLINKGRIIQFIFFQADRQILIVIGGNGVNGREDDRFEFLESGKRLLAGALIEGDGISDVDIRNRFYPCDDITHFPCGDFLTLQLSREKNPRPHPLYRWPHCKQIG